MVKLAGNFEKRDKNGINPGDKTEDEEQQPY